MILIKVGGGTNLNTVGIIEDIKALDQKVIFVHGASVQRDQVARQMGVPTKMISSPSSMKSVWTDKQALDILVMAYAGLVNKNWVSQFQAVGINAVGLSGADGRLLEGIRKKHLISVEDGKQKLISDTFTGKVTSANTTLLKLLIDGNYLPVVTQPAISDEGELINTDNDRNLAVIAGDIGIKEIVVLFEAPGLLTDINDPQSKVSQISHKDLDKYMTYAQGTMKKKLLGAQEAFSRGVNRIYWGDSRVDNPITNALAGKGTVIS